MRVVLKSRCPIHSCRVRSGTPDSTRRPVNVASTSRGTDLALSAHGAFVDGFHSALYLGAGALGLAAAVLLVIGPRVCKVLLDDGDEPEESQDEEGAGAPAEDRVLTAA